MGSTGRGVRPKFALSIRVKLSLLNRLDQNSVSESVHVRSSQITQFMVHFNLEASVSSSQKGHSTDSRIISSNLRTSEPQTSGYKDDSECCRPDLLAACERRVAEAMRYSLFVQDKLQQFGARSANILKNDVDFSDFNRIGR